MANENRFTDKGKAYAKGRPGYAEGAVEMIISDLLPEGGVVADIGSGTGKFSKEFISRGITTYCVEPNADMRAQAEALFAGDPHFISVEAPAEHTTLPDHSVDLVTAATAFHWFDADAFKAECQRILKPGGYVVLLVNSRTYNDEFTRRQHDICMETCPGFTSLHHGLDETIPKLESFFGDKLEYAEFDYPLTYTHDNFLERCQSSSYAPPADENGRSPYIDAMDGLMREFGCTGSFTLANVTNVHFGKLD